MTIYSLVIPLSQFWTSQLFHAGSNCCFLTCIQISQEAFRWDTSWYSNLFKNFPVFLWSTQSRKQKYMFFLECSCFFYDQMDVGNLISGPLPLLNPAWTSGSSWFTYCWSLAWRILSITLLAYTAAAAKSPQSCPTLCDRIDGSPPGSAVTGILQARILEWVAISFPNAWKWKVKVKLLSRVQLVATTWTAAHQAPLSTGFSRQEYWSGVLAPP